MAWGRIDDGFYRHRKTLALDPALKGDAIALFWMAISWSNDQLADGVITTATVRMLGWEQAIADELVRVGFLDVVRPDVWQVHNYGRYNKLRAQILAERAVDAERQAEYRREHPGRKTPPPASRGVSRRDSGRDQHRDSGSTDVDSPVDNPLSQRDTDRDQQRDTQAVSQPVSLARPVSRLPSPVTPFPGNSPPPPARRGRRSDRTNLRALGDNPRAVGEAPRQNGTAPRQERDALKRGPTRLGEIMGEALRRAEPPALPNGHANGQATIDELLP